MNDDEHLEVLREIRDALNEQTELVKAQWASYAKIAKWNQIVCLVLLFPLIVVAVTYLALN